MSGDPEDEGELPPAMVLPQAIARLEAKCARLEILIAAERGPAALYAKRMMEADVFAIRLLISKARGEF